MYNYFYFVYVFLVGNYGVEFCYNIYSWLGVNVVGNYYVIIIGGWKVGKNVLVVGNVEWNDLFLVSSSCGFMLDGCIKFDFLVLG